MATDWTDCGSNPGRLVAILLFVTSFVVVLDLIHCLIQGRWLGVWRPVVNLLCCKLYLRVDVGNLVCYVPSARGAQSGYFHYLFLTTRYRKMFCFCSTSATHFPRPLCTKCRQNCAVYNDSLIICPARDAWLSHLMTVPCTVIDEKSVVFFYIFINCDWVDTKWQ